METLKTLDNEVHQVLENIQDLVTKAKGMISRRNTGVSKGWKIDYTKVRELTKDDWLCHDEDGVWVFSTKPVYEQDLGWTVLDTDNWEVKAIPREVAFFSGKFRDSLIELVLP